MNERRVQSAGKYQNCTYSNIHFSLAIHQCLQMNLQYLEENITTLNYNHKEKGQYLKTESNDMDHL